MKKIFKLKLGKSGLYAGFLSSLFLLTLPISAFAFVRGQDGYNYYDYQSNYAIGGNFGNGVGGGLFCFSGSSYPTFCSAVNFFLGLIGRAIPILVSISVIVFVWGVFWYVIAADEERKKSSKEKMIYGIIGLFVMVSVWGLVAVVRNTLGLQNTNGLFFNYGGGFGSGFGGGFFGGGGMNVGGSGGGLIGNSGGGALNNANNSNNSGSPFGLPKIQLSPSDLSLPSNYDPFK